MGRKIEYSITVDDDLRLVHVEAHGVLDFANAQELSREAREMSSKCHYGIFYDFTDIAMDASVYDIFKFTSKINALQDMQSRNVRAAFLVSSGTQVDKWALYDLQSRNYGLLNRVYIEDKRRALAWASFGRESSSVVEHKA